MLLANNNGSVNTSVPVNSEEMMKLQVTIKEKDAVIKEL
jgi:hypothetical protein